MDEREDSNGLGPGLQRATICVFLGYLLWNSYD